MALEPANDDSDQGGGSPMWMVTYGDSITLLLTFFVMLLTFSTPTKEGMARLAKGIMKGSRTMSIFPGPDNRKNIVHMEPMLQESRLDESGAETPPMGHEDPLQKLRKQFKSLDVNKLKELQGGRVIRIPLARLFGHGTDLTADGTRVLDSVAQVLLARRYSVVVRAEAAGPVQGQAQRERSLKMAVAVAEHLASRAGQACADIGVSDNVQLLGTPVGAGTCEIVMLEV